jgi:hypothetical protein
MNKSKAFEFELRHPAGILWRLMTNQRLGKDFSRREVLKWSAAGATALASRHAFPSLPSSPQQSSAAASLSGPNLYAELVRTWCDGLLAHQITELPDPALSGGLLCPACGLIHGRCADAVYPLLHVAQITGDDKYLRGALRIYDWSERQVSRSDGSWINDVSLQDWQGITVFRAVAMAEALLHYGSLLDTNTRRRWRDRLAKAVHFLDGFITIDTGNINYPVSASYAFALCSRVLDEPRYLDRGRNLAHTCLDYISRPNHLIYGEGHPIGKLSPKGFRPVDLGYNVEESLPGFALYAMLTGDQEVLDATVEALRGHMEFMLPDGGWDNSWGCRNYKWTWWGSRTSDGCHPAYLLLAEHDPRFREVAQRNVELMAACTHNGLLYGGPDYFVHGDKPCIHHAFTHAKALTTVLDRDPHPVPEKRVSLPRDEAYGLRSFSEIGTHLAAIGPWRATVTEFDWKEPGEEGGHVTGGSLSLLFHHALGPLLTASMTEYELIEPPNQQGFSDAPHMELTPRIEYVTREETYSSFNDRQAVLHATAQEKEVLFDAKGRLQSVSHALIPGGGARYDLSFRITESQVEIRASAAGAAALPGKLQLVLPILSRSTEAVDHSEPGLIRLTKPGGTLTIATSAAGGFASLPGERTFNLVPGFEAIPVIVPMRPGDEIQIQLKAALQPGASAWLTSNYAATGR